MRFTSTKVLASKDGSTKPVVIQQQLEKEAAEIRHLWHCYGGPSVVTHLKRCDTLHRHKSLLLNLVLEDYDKVKEGSFSSVQLDEYCQRFLGLGDSLERSIYRQLEVRRYLDQHPDLLDLENSFNWPQPGETFLNFVILEELGHGALAKVYLCKQQNLADRLVVVKVALGAKFYEASLLGKLRHPHIMPVLWADYDEEADASYLCMPFVGRSTLVDIIEVAFREGEPQNSGAILDAANLWTRPHDREGIEAAPSTGLVTRKKSYVTGILKLAVAIADGLAWAHRQDVIHGDIKPSNVLLTPDGTPLLFDFNLGRDRLRTDGPAGGTLAYMAPEQLRCLAEDCSDLFPPPEIATDIYSFGVLLTELFAGKPPYEIADERIEAKAVAQLLYRQQQSISRSNPPELSGQLRNLIHDCLAFDPSQRPSSMADVRDRLSELLSVSSRGWRFAKAHPWRLSAAGTVCVAFVLCGGAYYATRTPLAESLFNQALIAQEAGKWQEGISLFGQALTVDPANHAARIRRARCYIALKDYASARTEFLELVREEDDPEAMAFLAYCDNLMNDTEPAIKWYRKAMDMGLTTPGILNNQSVSLLARQSTTPLGRRIAESRALLFEALEGNSESAIIRMNLVRLAKLELAQGSTASANIAAENIEWLCREHPTNPDVWQAAFLTYNSLAELNLASYTEAFVYLQKATELGAGPSLEQLKSGPKYVVYRELPEFDQFLKSVAPRDPESEDRQPIGRFLDPLTNEPSRS